MPMRNGRLLLASGLDFCVAALASLAALYLVTTRPGERHRAASYLPSGYALVVTGNDTAGLDTLDVRRRYVIRSTPLTYHRQSEDMLLSPDGRLLVVLGGRLGTTARGPSDVLSLVDTRAWRVLTTRSLPTRMQYNGFGPSTMTLSTDGTRLFVYHYKIDAPNKTEYWLAGLSARSLRDIGPRIELPDCGGAFFGAWGNYIVVLCSDAGDLRLVDSKRSRIVAVISLRRKAEEAVQQASPVGFVISKKRGEAYVVMSDLRIITVGLVNHAIRQVASLRRRIPLRVPTTDAVAIDARRNELVVGVKAMSNSGSFRFLIYRLLLPSVRPTKILALSRYSHFIVDTKGVIYTFPTLDAPWSPGKVNPPASGSAALVSAIRLPEPTLRLVLIPHRRRSN